MRSPAHTPLAASRVRCTAEAQSAGGAWFMLPPLAGTHSALARQTSMAPACDPSPVLASDSWMFALLAPRDTFTWMAATLSEPSGAEPTEKPPAGTDGGAGDRVHQLTSVTGTSAPAEVGTTTQTTRARARGATRDNGAFSMLPPGTTVRHLVRRPPTPLLPET